LKNESCTRCWLNAILQILAVSTGASLGIVARADRAASSVATVYAKSLCSALSAALRACISTKAGDIVDGRSLKHLNSSLTKFVLPDGREDAMPPTRFCDVAEALRRMLDHVLRYDPTTLSLEKGGKQFAPIGTSP
jgi:hypothetical protein